MQAPSAEQVLHAVHWQEPLQVRTRVPQLPQLSVSRTPGRHCPSPEQLPHGPHWQPAAQVRLRVPQVPQAPVWVSPG